MANATGDERNVLILTPVKDASNHLENYFSLISSLDYPAEKISIGMLESDSNDGTYGLCESYLSSIASRYRSTGIWKKDFFFRIPDGIPRYDERYQVERRSLLAKSRNHLLFNALQPEDSWVLWMDVDLIAFQPGILKALIEFDLDIVHPDCVQRRTDAERIHEEQSFDLNAWRDHGSLHMHDMRSEGELVPLDSVGGTMLLVRANAHRDGLIFPAFKYGTLNSKIRPKGVNGWYGEIETEGFGIMASDLGYSCWGATKHQTIHR